MGDTFDNTTDRMRVPFTDSVQVILDSQRERRRYALLQAAVSLVIARRGSRWVSEIPDAVADAESILAEIERRETVQEPSPTTPKDRAVLPSSDEGRLRDGFDLDEELEVLEQVCATGSDDDIVEHCRTITAALRKHRAEIERREAK